MIDVGLSQEPPYDLVATASSVPQAISFYGSRLTLWGDPSDPSHDPYRGSCLQIAVSSGAPQFTSAGECPIAAPEEPFLTLPRSCTGPATSSYAADSWQNPGALLPDGEPDLTDPNWVTGSALTHDNAEPPNPQGFTGCNRLGFDPTITAKPTTKAADSPTGLDFSLDVNDEGLTNPTGIADSDIKKAEVTLPEGFSTNPSLAEGLNVCTEADLERETVESAPGAGCPDESKIGTVELESPLIEESVNGALYIAKPYENPSHSLLALYMVIKNPNLGIIIKQPLKVETNPETGQLTTVADNLPQLPFSHFRLHFREGARSPLVSPPGCGEYSAKAVLTPWSGGEAITTTSAFQIISGPDNGPCPPKGTPPFHPGLDAGTINNAAGHYSPFYLRLSRQDGEQEITHFSIKLPPGVIGKLAGIPFCSDAAIAAAKARTGPHGGQEELEHPSCPTTSEVGHTLVGAGVGSALTYAPGKLYLAGPYHGSNLSIAAITAAKVGPFDLGTVVVRQALRINPETAEVFIDATGSDPIPHIIQGIPVHLRDIRVYVDRPEFTLNPTSCAKNVHREHRARLRAELRLRSRRPAGHRDLALPGRRLRQPRLQTQAGPVPQGRYQARRHPQVQGGPDGPQGRRQYRPSPGHPATLGVPRTEPHRHRLHQGSVQGRDGPRRKVPRGEYLRPRQRSDPIARRTALGRCLPALLLSQAPRPGRGPAQQPGRLRPRRPHRFRQERQDSQHLRNRAGCPGEQVRPRNARRQQGLASEQHEFVRSH